MALTVALRQQPDLVALHDRIDQPLPEPVVRLNLVCVAFSTGFPIELLASRFLGAPARVHVHSIDCLFCADKLRITFYQFLVELPHFASNEFVTKRVHGRAFFGFEDDFPLLNHVADHDDEFLVR